MVGSLPNPMRVPTKIKVNSPDFIPMYKTKGAAAADLVANISEDTVGERSIKILPGHIETIDCGFAMELPPGWEAQIRPRSGLSKKGLQVSLGTIDDDYRDNIMVTLNNTGKEIIVIKHKQRIAQMSLKPVWYFEWQIVSDLSINPDSDRVGGFGSTGL